jgi:hypothetical protein
MLQRCVFPSFVFAILLTACSANSPSDTSPSAGTTSSVLPTAGNHATAGSVSSVPTAGMPVVVVTSGTGSVLPPSAGKAAAGTGSATAGTGAGGGAAGSTGAAGAAAGTGGKSGASGSGTAGSTASGSDPAMLTGTLGALGAAKPTKSALWISNGLETLIYLISAPLTCDQMKVNGWLRMSLGADVQVLEVVVKGAAMAGQMTAVGGFGGGEANYAAGAKSSSYEKTASGGTINFTKAEAMGVIEGTVMATYTNPTGDVMGSFHADFCAGGTEY